jgi:translation elongation factor EF-1alpha
MGSDRNKSILLFEIFYNTNLFNREDAKDAKEEKRRKRREKTQFAWVVKLRFF